MNDAEQSLAERVVNTMMAKDAFSQRMGMEVVEVRPNAATVRMRVTADMLNGFGVCHGGATFSLADSALAFASNTHGRITMSVENSIRYPAPIAPGEVLTATAVQESAGRRLAFFNVTVRTDRGDIVGLFRGTVYRTSRDHFDEEQTLGEIKL